MTQASINNLNEQVQQYSLLIANKQAELEASQAEEQRLNEQYKTRIRSMEETGNISYWAICSARTASRICWTRST